MKEFSFNFDVEIPKPIDIFAGMQDMLAYACKRFHVKSTRELTDDMYSHACAEYMTALIRSSREFRAFVKQFCN